MICIIIIINIKYCILSWLDGEMADPIQTYRGMQISWHPSLGRLATTVTIHQ